jgi:hypothetical protein
MISQHEDNILETYTFPYDTGLTLKSCDFHLKDEEKNNNLLTTSIPCTLKIFSPCLILFYFNKDKEILDKWQKLGTKTPEDTTLNIEQVEFKCINLDYEKKLYGTFQNLSVSNPFRWLKIQGNNKRYFILFYLSSVPKEFYDGEIDLDAISDEYYSNDSNDGEKSTNYINKIKDEKFRIFDRLNLKENYFVALKNDYPTKGITKGKYYKIIEKKPGTYDFIEL